MPLAAGNLAWDQGFRRSDGQLLGLEMVSWGLLTGAIVIVLAGLLSRTDARQAQS